MSRLIDEHRAYLSDAARIDAFRRAIAERVREGDTVVDLGAGTGILGLLACEAGAARVYAIDSGPVIEIARRLARDNGFADRIVHLREVSTWTRLTEPVDVIVTDQIGHFGFEAGLIEFMRDAARRWLKPGGRTVPLRVDLLVAPVEHPELRSRIDFWRDRAAGFDVSSVYPQACNSGYPFSIEGGALLGEAARVIQLDPIAGPDFYRGDATLEIARDGVLDAVAGWFSAQLSPSIRMTNAPGDPNRIGRRQVLLPLTPRTVVHEGDRVRATVSMRPADTLVTWTADLVGADGQHRAAVRHSTLDGMLIAHDDVARSAPSFVPALTPAGEARRSVLELCDGRRPIADIEREMRLRHPALIPDAASAAAFVAEVLSVYAR